MFVLLTVLCLLVAAALILAVVVQNSKGGGLSSAIVGGGATQILGARRSTEFIEKITWGLAVALVVIAFAGNLAGHSQGGEYQRLRTEDLIEDQVITNTQGPIVAPGEDDIQAGKEAAPATEPEGN